MADRHTSMVGRRAGPLTDVHRAPDVAARKVGITHINDGHAVVVGPAGGKKAEERQRRSAAAGGGAGAWRVAPLLPSRGMCTAALNKPAGGHARGRGTPHKPILVNRPKRSTRGPVRPGNPHPRRRAFTRTGASTVTALAQAIVSRAGRAAASAACWGRPGSRGMGAANVGRCGGPG